MEYVCWRLMLFLIIRLPGMARRTVCMKPNSFQVSPPKVLMSQHSQSLLADGCHTPSVCEAASSQRRASPLQPCSLQHYPNAFLVLQLSVIPLRFPQTGSTSSCSSPWELCPPLPVEPVSLPQAGWWALAGGHFGGVGGSTLLRSQSSGEHAVL